MTAKRQLSDWLSAYMEYSAFSEAPDKFHFWTGVSCIAGALRRRVWIDQGYFQWTPNFYIVFVAPPGIVSKSTTASIGMRLLRQIPDVIFGPDAVTWQSLVQSLANATETCEINGEHHSMSAITISSSEFGTFLNPNDREMVDVLVSLWDGQIGTWQKATKTQGSDSIENPWININACTTPDWIAGNFPEYMIGGGFTSRTVFVYADKKRHLVPYPKNCIPENFKDMEKELVHDLEIIATEIKGEYILTAETMEWGTDWYTRHFASRPPHLDSARFGGYLARKQTHIHKLAMIIAASESSELLVHPHHLEKADQITTSIEHDMPKVFSNIGKTDLTRISTEVLGFLQSHHKYPLQGTYQKFFERVSLPDFETVMKGLAEAGYVSTRNEGGVIMLIANHTEKGVVDGASNANVS